MNKVYVQFSDVAETKISSVFCGPQDPNIFPNQGIIDDSDPRYQAFLSPATATLVGAQNAKIAELQQSYQSSMNTPVTLKNAVGVTSTYPSGVTLGLNGLTAKQNLADVLAAGASAWIFGKWIDTNNVAQTFTFADLQALAAAMETAVVPYYINLMAKVAEVQAATTIPQVQSIIF